MTTLRTSDEAESPYAWTRLWVALALVTIGGWGMYSMGVVLPPLQEEFGIPRADASLPFTLTMIGFGLGSVLMGRLSDRFGVIVPVVVGSVSLALGFVTAGFSQNLLQFTAVHGLLIGVGTSGTFVPLVADVTLWFTRRRGIAVAVWLSGNYLAGTVCPPLMQHFIDTAGWRATYMGTGLICLFAMPLFALALRRKPPAIAGLAPAGAGARGASSNPERPLGFSPNQLQGLLCGAGAPGCGARLLPPVPLFPHLAHLGFPPPPA